MAGSNAVTILAPLAVCTKLLKLDLRGCRSELRGRVADLQLKCVQLADPASVAIEGLMHDLQPSIAFDIQARAALGLEVMCRMGGSETQDAIVAAGAIPALMRLLRADSSAGAQEAAALALQNLGANHAQNQAAMVTAGAIPALVRLTVHSSAGVQQAAAGALNSLAQLQLIRSNHSARVAGTRRMWPLFCISNVAFAYFLYLFPDEI